MLLLYVIHFRPTKPEIFLKAPLAPIYTNFAGERAPQKRNFLMKIFQKVPKNGFFDLFFNSPAAQNPPSQSRKPRSASSVIE